ncbi:hypothetical protein DFQ26_000599 [Actinomortierella ambigua]|nr:hypothetical protein DFQ26_000599 [Actinomortierella ambigua]
MATSDSGKNYHDENRESWNQVIIAHNSHKKDQHEFFKNKGSTLFQEEKELLGNLAGLSVCHLQCNAGQDTLSLITKLGAQNPTGVDISDTAIDFARQLAKDSGLEATFIRSDVFDYFDETEPNQFDVVFISYGALCWLSDIDRWARGVHRILKPATGRVVLIEFHPVLGMFNEEFVRDYPYCSHGKAMTEPEGISNYVARSGVEGEELYPGLVFQTGIQDFRNTKPSHEFCWSVSSVIQAALNAGLTLQTFKEYPFSNFCKFYTDMRPEKVPEGVRWYPSGQEFPCMYSIVGSKP